MEGRLVAYVTFYDRQGRAVAWFDDEQDNPAIYLYSGRPVAWISDESIYAYSGAHLGWFVDGWIRDSHGHAVLFTPDCSGGPARPARHARPARGARQARPARGARHARPARPARTTSWSPLSGDAFFLR
ncbi:MULTISPECIES: 4-fold beta flower protein [unclassified Pseudomonas]